MRITYQVSVITGFLLFSFTFATKSYAQNEMCVYRTEQGQIIEVASKRDVPREYRREARCASRDQFRQLASPDKIELEGSVRRANISTSLGSIEARWPRTAEKLFGRTPNKALSAAANATAKAIQQAGFRIRMRSTDLPWKVIFLDANLPETQIPLYLQRSCHPGWMTPPANIYIVAQRVAAGCSGAPRSRRSVADADLAETLVHEMGHVVEHQLLDFNSRDRLRSEGFATWFEMYTSRFDSSLNPGAIKTHTKALAYRSVQDTPNYFLFKGTGEDYSRASMYFLAVQERRGARAIAELYETMNSERIDLFEAIDKKLHWDRARLEKEVQKLLPHAQN